LTTPTQCWLRNLFLPALFLIFFAAYTEVPHAAAQDAMLQPQTEKNYQPHSYQGKVEPDDGQWIRPAKDYASTRYSSLDQINTNNVKNLKLAFTFST
jgi:glucose dehydrogenase